VVTPCTAPALCAVIIIQPAQTGALLLGQSDEIAANFAGKRCQPLSDAMEILAQIIDAAISPWPGHSLQEGPTAIPY